MARKPNTVTKEQENEVLRAIATCQEKGVVEDGILSTRVLTDRLNTNSSRSREWNTFWAGQVMGRLGFKPTVTPITYQRGWQISDEIAQSSTALSAEQTT